ncbi:MAG: F0F1 ATP synthase subunit epsilon [Deltaproteobacteria bacterium]|nr:F0F1 ATP synthase subunit epsilon [Deltaproteobacteria bacterium]
MNTFTLHLFAADRCERIEDVASFVGEDKSGSFGLLARHDRFMTALTFGLARLLLADGSREYLALPSGLLYFIDNELRISTRRYLRDTNAENLAEILSREMLEEEQALNETRHKLHRLEAEMLRRLAQLGMD